MLGHTKTTRAPADALIPLKPLGHARPQKRTSLARRRDILNPLAFTACTGFGSISTKWCPRFSRCLNPHTGPLKSMRASPRLNRTAPARLCWPHRLRLNFNKMASLFLPPLPGHLIARALPRGSILLNPLASIAAQTSAQSQQDGIHVSASSLGHSLARALPGGSILLNTLASIAAQTSAQSQQDPLRGAHGRADETEGCPPSFTSPPSPRGSEEAARRVGRARQHPPPVAVKLWHRPPREGLHMLYVCCWARWVRTCSHNMSSQNTCG
jgi:hypothetical protein